MSKVPFKISARTAGLIGKENIASAEGAVIELAKNSYDADASNCVILFDFTDKKKPILFIIDNGEGMSEKTILDNWMTIGTSNKLHSPYSKDRRIKSGAKGIGRFALDRLGKEITMFSIPKKSGYTYEWKANWEEFDDKKTLDAVFADIDIREKDCFKKEIDFVSGKFKPLKKIVNNSDFSSGTILKISKLNDVWDDEAIKKLFKNTESLVPPQPHPNFFLHIFDTRTESEYGKVESLFWDDYDYKLIANVQIDGRIEIAIDRREFNWKNIRPAVFKEKYPKDMSKKPYNLDTLKKGDFSFKTSIEELFPGLKENSLKQGFEKLGPFDFHFYFLKRTAKSDDSKIYSYRSFDSNIRKEWLDKFGGIKLFRDNFRVRPYGEINSTSWDWLELGNRAAASTFGSGQSEGLGWRVGSNQIYGYVNISRINNPELKDTTNREGLVDNRTFYSFKKLLEALINVVEKDRHYISRPMKVVYDKEEKLAQAKEEAQIQAEKDLGEANQKRGRSKNNSKKTTYARATKAFVEEIKEKDDEIKILKSLASIGMTISTLTHDLGDVRDSLVIYPRKLKHFVEAEINQKKFENEKTLIKNPFMLMNKIIEQITRMNNWIDFSRKALTKDRRKASDIGLKKYFDEFKQRWNDILVATKTKLLITENIGTGKLKNAYPIDLDSIFNNLLLNSIYEFLRKDALPIRDIKIHITSEKKGVSVVYEDSGAGLHKSIKDPNVIFEEFFSTKKKGENEVGIGLGMWIVKKTVEEYNGYAEIINSRQGFKIKIYFPVFSN